MSQYNKDDLIKEKEILDKLLIEINRRIEKPMVSEERDYYSYVLGMEEVRNIVRSRLSDIHYILEWEFDDED